MIYTYKSSFVLLLRHFLVNISTAIIDKVVLMLSSQRRWTYVVSTFLFNQILTLKQHWIDLILSTLFQHCFVNVETTSIMIRRLNLHFQSNFNNETTLVHRRWINVILSTSFQRCFANVEITSINVRQLSLHFQPNINLETTLMNLDDQRWFNVDVFTGYMLKIFSFPRPSHKFWENLKGVRVVLEF